MNERMDGTISNTNDRRNCRKSNWDVSGALFTGWDSRWLYCGLRSVPWEAAHSYGMRDTPRLKAMYQEPGTIYLYSMHGNLILNIVTQNIGIPQGVMIRGLEPIDGIEQMQVRRGKTGSELSNGPGKLVAALGITKELYGRSIFTSPLRLVPERKRQPKKIVRLPRIGIPNKGSWTNAPLRYVAWGNPYVTNIRKKEIDDHYGWSYE